MKLTKIKIAFTIMVSSAIIGSCTKADKDDDFPPGDVPPVAGGFNSSSEIAPANLIAHFPMDGNIADLKGTVTGGVAKGVTSFVAGKKGQAYKGSTTGFIEYGQAGAIATLKSLTVSMWINALHHDGGAQGVFDLGKNDGSFWGNFFMLIEGQNPASQVEKMFMKLHFEKNGASITEHWIEPFGDFRPDDMYNAWKHVVWTYDETTSKAALYINGSKRVLPPNQEDRFSATGVPLGPLNFKDPLRFVIGGFAKHTGTPFGAPEQWMLKYTGMLDEFRIYNKALSGKEIAALTTLEGRGD